MWNSQKSHLDQQPILSRKTTSRVYATLQPTKHADHGVASSAATRQHNECIGSIGKEWKERKEKRNRKKRRKMVKKNCENCEAVLIMKCQVKNQRHA